LSAITRDDHVPSRGRDRMSQYEMVNSVATSDRARPRGPLLLLIDSTYRLVARSSMADAEALIISSTSRSSMQYFDWRRLEAQYQSGVSRRQLIGSS
jgi:hypothetical protein